MRWPTTDDDVPRFFFLNFLTGTRLFLPRGLGTCEYPNEYPLKTLSTSRLSVLPILLLVY